MIISQDKILFFDIETAPQTVLFEQLNDEMQHLWAEKQEKMVRTMPQRYEGLTPKQGYETTAGIYAEFGRIVCISVGLCYIHKDDGEWHLRTRSFFGTDERLILTDFFELLARFFTTPYHCLCGHNSKEFDIPYVCRRALIHGLPLPSCLDIAGKKPWEINHIDTMELWKFGDYKNYTSLKTLTAVFGIPTPKDDIDGSEVAQVYYQEQNLQRISTYCQKDVVATCQVYLRLKGLPLIQAQNIENAN